MGGSPGSGFVLRRKARTPCGIARTRSIHVFPSARRRCGRRVSQPSRSAASCSPSSGGAVTSSARSPSNETGERTVRKRPIVGCSVSTKSCRCLACGSSGTSAVVYIGACGTSLASRRRHHSSRLRFTKIAPSTSIRSSWCSMRAVAGREARVLEQVRPLDRDREALPELLRRRHVQREPLAVGARHHVRLRDARPAVRPHHLADREQVREGVEVEVRHRLEHRDLDRAAVAGRCRSCSAPRMP